ncbi:MAG: zinc ribbon domain-containing protein [Lautropia sp.]|nr:zinc ribbon domain-containing protein [Lautropia sp.]
MSKMSPGSSSGSGQSDVGRRVLPDSFAAEGETLFGRGVRSVSVPSESAAAFGNRVHGDDPTAVAGQGDAAAVQGDAWGLSRGSVEEVAHADARSSFPHATGSAEVAGKSGSAADVADVAGRAGAGSDRPSVPHSATVHGTIAVGKRPCPECGAGLEWNARKQALSCPYCGTVVSWSESSEGIGDGSEAAGIGEQDLEAALRNPANVRDWGSARREVRCQSCHAVSVFVDGKVAQRCDFCGSPSIVPHEELRDAIVPQSILPFKYGDQQVRDLIRKWYGSRWFAPNRLKSAALTDTLQGIYLPYWTFDAHTHAVWRAEAGHYYYEMQTVRGPDGKPQMRQVQKVRWVPAAGQLRHFFDDELVPGTVGVHAALLRRIEPFPTRTDLKPYSPEYVRGWTVERYQVDLRKASVMGQQQMADKLRAMCAARVPGDTHRNLVVDARFDGRTFKHVLVPVWLVHYRFGARNYQVVVNGYTGRVAGEQPYSWFKIALALIAASIVLGLLFYSQR